jgi:tetratricopeptide (TPR) repeat protein
MDQLPKAEEYYIRASKIFEKSGRLDELADVYEALGRIYQRLGNDSAAKKHLLAAFDIYSQKQDQQQADRVQDQLLRMQCEENELKLKKELERLRERGRESILSSDESNPIHEEEDPRLSGVLPDSFSGERSTYPEEISSCN